MFFTYNFLTKFWLLTIGAPLKRFSGFLYLDNFTSLDKFLWIFDALLLNTVTAAKLENKLVFIFMFCFYSSSLFDFIDELDIL